MDEYEHLLEKRSAIEQKIGYSFQNKDLLVLAFVHRSFYNEHRQKVAQHNERLEFLGDSVLSILISEFLYVNSPGLSEGQLSHMRSFLVEASTCAYFVQKLSLEESILLGKGEKMSEGKKKESIRADLFEALLGALFLDGGLEAAKRFFWSQFSEEVDALLQKPSRNWKAELQDYAQKKHQKTPLYHVLSAQGPDHCKEFEVAVFLEDILLGQGKGASKKEAEQEAAKEALSYLEGKK